MINKDKLTAFEKEVEEIDTLVSERGRLINKLSQQTKLPLGTESSWNGGYPYKLQYFEGWEATDEYMWVNYESEACGRGCCGNEGETLRIPWSVWENPTLENIEKWLNPIAEEKQIKKDMENKSKELEKIIQERAMLEELKEKYDNEEL